MPINKNTTFTLREGGKQSREDENFFFSACFFDGLIEDREPVSKPVRKTFKAYRESIGPSLRAAASFVKPSKQLINQSPR